MDSASQILEIAERRMRQVGYNAVSYRDIAAEIGIKSASLHYHFPKKEDLGIALVKRYSENFNAQLTATTAGETDPKKMLAAFVEIYRYALQDQGLVCLCAVLGAEAPGLPHPITTEIKNFFENKIVWLTARYDALGLDKSTDHAKTTIALLEGAMIVSSVNDDMSVFEAAVESIESKHK